MALWDFNGERFLSGWDEEVRTKRLHESELAAGRQPAPAPHWKPEDESAEIVSEAEAIDSFVLLMTGWVSPNALGYAFAIGQAVVVALLADLEYVGLRKSAAVAA